MILPESADDASMLAILNMQAHQRVALVPKDPPMNSWGLDDDVGYQTRLMDKKKIHFDVEIRPLDTYVKGNPLWPLAPPPSPDPGNPMAKIPLWYNIHDQFAPQIWNLALAATMTVVMLRPGMDAKGIEACLRPCMETWELNLVLGWAVKAGAILEYQEGYMTAEWWWLCLDDGSDSEDLASGVGASRIHVENT